MYGPRSCFFPIPGGAGDTPAWSIPQICVEPFLFDHKSRISRIYVTFLSFRKSCLENSIIVANSIRAIGEIAATFSFFRVSIDHGCCSKIGHNVHTAALALSRNMTIPSQINHTI